MCRIHGKFLALATLLPFWVRRFTGTSSLDDTVKVSHGLGDHELYTTGTTRSCVGAVRLQRGRCSQGVSGVRLSLSQVSGVLLH